MRAITVQQPWAWAIAAGVKTVENRRRTTPHRGPIAIHAGLRWSEIGEHIVPQLSTVNLPMSWREPGGLPRGKIVAVADLIDAHPETGRCCQPWGRIRWSHWVLENIRALDQPVQVAGQVGLWTLPDDAEQAVAEQLPEVGRGG